MKVLVTGAAGFIGSHLVQTLLARGDSVVAVDNLTDYYDLGQKRNNLNLFSEHEAATVLIEDMADPAVLERVGDVDVVYHLGGQPGVRLSWDRSFALYVERNIDRTQQLLEAARAAKLPRFVYASSSSVYGNQPAYPVDERAVPAPFSPYGVTKLAAEHLCSLYAQNYDLHTVSLRFFTVYGPRQRPDMAFSKFIRSALLDQPINVTGDGTAIRDFTYVDDIVSALVAASQAQVPSGSIFNTCGDESISVNGVIDLIATELGMPITVEKGPSVAGDVQRTGGLSNAALNSLQWQPIVTLREGIARQVAWERSRATGR